MKINFNDLCYFKLNELYSIAKFCNIDYNIYYLNFDNNIIKSNLLDSKFIIINKLLNYFNNNFQIDKPSFINNCHINFFPSYNIIYNLNTPVQLHNFNFSLYNCTHFLNSINIKPTQYLFDCVLYHWINNNSPFNYNYIKFIYISNSIPKYDNYIFNINKKINSCLIINNIIFIPIIFNIYKLLIKHI